MNKILYFSASWCGPCKQLGPVVNQLKNEGFPINRVDVDGDPNLTSNYSIKSVPTLVLVDSSGRELKRSSNIRSSEGIKNWFNN